MEPQGYVTPPIVLDTNVLVAGACRRSGSMAYRILKGVLHEQIPLVLTPAIALEYQDVLLRPRILELTRLTHEQSVELVTLLISLAREVHLSFHWRPNLRDETDDKFVEAAIHGGATIVTHNLSDYLSSDMARHGWDATTPQDFLLRHSLEELT
jgi:putative PIN family toxin of toxin-antitoxin system